MSKDKTPATLTVDVLKILNDAEEVLRRNGFKEIPDDLELARAAVAELIDAAEAFNTYVAAERGDKSILDQDAMWDRLETALARVRGAA